MSSYDCVLPIPYSTLTSLFGELPVLLASRTQPSSGGIRGFEAIRRGAAEMPPAAGFYGTLGDNPRVAVAGSKNGFHLPGLTREYVPERWLYRCRWDAPSRETELFDLLLHGVRVLPGMRYLLEAPAWPAFDDPMVLGYLLPDEVCELDALAGPLSDSPHTVLLRDILARAAARSLCLVTLQSGLM